MSEGILDLADVDFKLIGQDNTSDEEAKKIHEALANLKELIEDLIEKKIRQDLDISPQTFKQYKRVFEVLDTDDSKFLLLGEIGN